jgi:cytochrome-b5 reductase
LKAEHHKWRAEDAQVSSGTGIAPFLQLLSVLPASNASGPAFDLIHASPSAERIDWVTDPALVPSLKTKHGDRISVHRFLPGSLPLDELDAVIKEAGSHNERIKVLICLPPA